MTDIKHYPLVHHLRAGTTTYVLHLDNGRVRHAGAGLAFWFRPNNAALSEVPLDDRDQALLFHARTADFQDVTVQATVNYRVVDPALATTRIDFGIAPDTGQMVGTPLVTLGGLLTELAQQPALDEIAGMTMAAALARGIAPVRNRVAAALATDPRLGERGLAVTDVRVVAIRTDPELERALQTQTREAVQQEADRATFERRALAVDSERGIAENELRNQIELARQEEELVVQQGQNERKRANERAEAERIAAEASAERQRLLADATANTTRLVGEAEGDAEHARLAAYREVEQATLIGLALKELAANLPNINNLTVTPDLLAPVLARLAQADPTPISSPRRRPRPTRRRRSDDAATPSGHRAPALRVRGADRPARHPPAGGLLPRGPSPHPRPGPRPASGRAGGLAGRVGGHARGLAMHRPGTPRSRPIRVRTRRHGGRGRPGRARGQRGQVPRRPTGGRDRTPTRTGTRGSWSPTHRRQPPGCSGRRWAAIRAIEERTMVEAATDDGQRLRALNEVYRRASDPSVGPLRDPDPRRRDVRGSLRREGCWRATGTGATGWLRSAWQERHEPAHPPAAPTSSELCWFVREAWPSPATGARSHRAGPIAAGDRTRCHGRRRVRPAGLLRRRDRIRRPAAQLGAEAGGAPGAAAPPAGGRPVPRHRPARRSRPTGGSAHDLAGLEHRGDRWCSWPRRP